MNENHRPFTEAELFTVVPAMWIGCICAECGALVEWTRKGLHTEWHNKVADL